MNSFYSLKRIKYIYHGDWSDPELIYHKKSYNYYDIEDLLYNEYIEIQNQNGVETTFQDWIKKNKSLCYSLINECIEYLKEY